MSVDKITIAGKVSLPIMASVNDYALHLSKCHLPDVPKELSSSVTVP